MYISQLGLLAGSKINISTTTKRETSTTTTYKTTFPTPTQAWTTHIKVGTTPDKTTTIQVQAQKKTPTRQKPSIGYVVIPHTKGIAESFKNICGKYGIQAYFKGNTTIKQILMKPKDTGPQGQEEWDHMQLPVWGYCLQ